MGLTGVILNATIQLIPIQSSYINQKLLKQTISTQPWKHLKFIAVRPTVLPGLTVLQEERIWGVVCWCWESMKIMAV